VGAGALLAENPLAWRSFAPAGDAGASRRAEGLMKLDREVFAKMMDAAKKGVLLTALAAAAYAIQPVLTAGVALVALAQYYRMAKFMRLHDKLQKAVREALIGVLR
jgi:hypothetical protein